MCLINIILFSSSLTSSHKDLEKCYDEKLGGRVTTLIDLKNCQMFLNNNRYTVKFLMDNNPLQTQKVCKFESDDPEEGPELIALPSLKWRRLGGPFGRKRKEVFHQ